MFPDRQVRQIKQACQADVDSLQRQLGQLTATIVRLEHDTAAAHTASREAAQAARRGQDDVRALFDGQRDQTRVNQRRADEQDALQAEVTQLR